MAAKSSLQVAADKAMKKKNRGKGGGARKYNRNRKKCESYRARVGKPNGPGATGQKH